MKFKSLFLLGIIMVGMVLLFSSCEILAPNKTTVKEKDPVTGEVKEKTVVTPSNTENTLNTLGNVANTAGDFGLPFGKILGGLFLAGAAAYQQKRINVERKEKEKQIAEHAKTTKGATGIVGAINKVFASMPPDEVTNLMGSLSENMGENGKALVKVLNGITTD